MTSEEVQGAYEMMSCGMSLSDIGEHLGFAKTTVYNNMRKDLAQYAHAREAQAQFYVDKIIKLAEDAERGMPSEINASQRLAVDTYKWLACKFLPREYGDKQQVEHSGGIDFPKMVVVEGVKSDDPDKPGGDAE